MQNFAFYNPVKILFGKGQIANIAKEIPAGAKILVVYGNGSIKSNDVIPLITERFEKRGFMALGEHQDVTPKVVEKILALCA